MPPEIEIGTMGVVLATFIASCMLIGGFFLFPAQFRVTAIGAACMFVGWAILEFILDAFVVIAR